MKFRIPKGKHRARPWRFALWWNKTVMRRRVIFYPSCKYDLPGTEDDQDTNKLFGIGYLSFRWNPHHRDSVRFGWFYNQPENKIMLVAYCYVSGQRIIKNICQAIVGWSYNLEILIDPNGYEFRVWESNRTKFESISIPRIKNRKFGFRLGTYFGGNQPAPSEIIIDLKKI